MPENRPKRPRDPGQLAKLKIDIASDEVEDREPTPNQQGKHSGAVELGRRGGHARANKLDLAHRVSGEQLLKWRRAGKVPLMDRQ
jgi:hypothetical protein